MLQTCSKFFGLSTATWHRMHVMNEISMHTQALFVYTVYMFFHHHSGRSRTGGLSVVFYKCVGISA